MAKDSRKRYRKNRKDPEFRRLRNEKNLAKHYESKRLVFEHYGVRCACCGEDEPLNLTIDHIDPCGKKRQHNLYPRWLRHTYPTGFQTLCWNCNISKSNNNGFPASWEKQMRERQRELGKKLLEEYDAF
jgi:hypothetical protein